VESKAVDSKAAIEMLGVRFRWPGAAEDCLVIPELRFESGEAALVYGPSGCGKSTLLSLMAGVVVPQAGAIRFHEHEWQQLPVAQRDRFRADHVGYIFQQFNLLPYLSALDNVLLPCRVSSRRAGRVAMSNGRPRVEAECLLRKVGLGPAMWTRHAAELSVGEQQRVAAARALIGRPELVIADEPTSALDEPLRDAFMALLLEACAEAGSTLIFVSHDTRLAQYFRRRIDLPAINRAHPQGYAA
jgi:putative ABC transport system ATP-binding protein